MEIEILNTYSPKYDFLLQSWEQTMELLSRFEQEQMKMASILSSGSLKSYRIKPTKMRWWSMLIEWLYVQSGKTMFHLLFCTSKQNGFQYIICRN